MHPFINVTYSCFPSRDSYVVNINSLETGFPTQFFITQWWSLYPALQTTLYAVGGIQLALSIAGFILATGRKVDMQREHAWLFYSSHKVLPLLTSIWQFFLSLFILLLPTQWLSNVTTAMILFHSWAEFYGMVLRFLVLRKDEELNAAVFDKYIKWMLSGVGITGAFFACISNPYAQGIITAIPVLPADFLNLVVSPLLVSYWMKLVKSYRACDTASEVLSAMLYIIHVIWFYGQGLIACRVSIEAGAQFFIALQIVSTAVYLGVIIANIVTAAQYKEWRNPMGNMFSFSVFKPTTPEV